MVSFLRMKRGNSISSQNSSALDRLMRSFRNTRIDAPSKVQNIGDLIEPATPVESSGSRNKERTEFWTMAHREKSDGVIHEEDQNRLGWDSPCRNNPNSENSLTNCDTYSVVQQRMERRVELKIAPPRFSGKSDENIKNFFSRFQKLVVHRNVGENQLLEWLGLLLDGEALVQFDIIMAREDSRGIEGYRNVKENMMKRFGKGESKMSIKSKLYDRKMKPNENVTQYFCSIEKECGKLEDISENEIFSFS